MLNKGNNAPISTEKLFRVQTELAKLKLFTLQQ